MMQSGVETKQETQKALFDDIGQSLDHLKVKLESGDKAKTEEHEIALYDCLLELSGSIDNAGEKQSFNIVLDKLKDPEVQVTSQEVEALHVIVSKIEAKNLDKTDLDKLRTKVRSIRSIKGSLAQVIESIDPVAKYKEKVETAKANFIAKIKENPFMGKLAMYLLPNSMRDSITKHVEDAVGKPGWFVSFLGDMGGFGKFVAKLVLTWFGGKSILNSIEVMKSVRDKVPEGVQDVKEFFGKEGVQNLTQAVKQAKEEGEEIVDDKIKQYKVKLKKEFREYVKKRMGVRDKSDEEIDAVIEEFIENEHKKGTFKFKEALKKYTEGGEGEYFVLDGFIDTFKGSSMMLRFIFSMIRKGIVKPQDFVIQTAEHYMSYGVISLGLIKDSLGKFKGEIDPEEFLKVSEELELTEGEKTFIAYLLYRKGGMFFNLMGSVAAGITKGVLYFPAYCGQDLSQFSARWHAFRGNYDKQLNIIKGLQDKIGDTAKHGDKLVNFRSALGEMDDFYKFWGWFVANESEMQTALKSGNNLEQFARAKNIDIDLIKRFVGNNLDVKDFKVIKGNIAESISKVGNKVALQAGDWKSVAGGRLKGGTSSTYVYQQFGNEMRAASKSLSEIVRNDDLFTGYRQLKNHFVDKIKLGSSLSKQIQLSDNFMLAFKDVDDFKGWMEETRVLMRKSPGTVKFLFSKLPIIAIAGFELTKDDPTVTGFIKDLRLLIPVIGPLCVLSEQGIKFNNGKMEFHGDPTIAMFSVGMLTYDAYYVTKQLMGNPHKVRTTMKLLAQPLIDVAELAGAASRGVNYGIKYGKDTAKLISQQGIRQTVRHTSSEVSLALKEMKFGRILKSRPAMIGLLLLAGAAYYTDGFGLFDGDEELKKEFEEAVEKGDFAKYEKALQEAWVDLDEGEKQEQLRNIIRMRFYVMGYANIDSIRFYDNRIYVNYHKYIPKLAMMELKEDILKRIGHDKYNLQEPYTDLIMSVDDKDALKNILAETLNVPIEDIISDDLKTLQKKIRERKLRIKEKDDYVVFDQNSQKYLEDTLRSYGYEETDITQIIGTA